ncbi:MAG: GIDE domain-containing protein, partial [Candidatus Micrarchaeota archaeon]|nr:GIDE domain-containing protein [Candidatus Micrarchaeota archaeon]
SKVRAIAMGPVEVFGKVVPSEQGLLEAPFTGKPCVYYRFKVEEYVGGKNRQWHTVASGKDARRFFIRDETGDVLVDSKDAEVDLPSDFFQSGNKAPPERVQAFMQSRKLGMKSFIGLNKNMRYTEYHLAPDDDIFVSGNAGSNSDLDGAGISEGFRKVLIGKGGKKDFFYISDKAENKVLDGLKWQVWGGILGGMALLAIGLIWLLSHWKIL